MKLVSGVLIEGETPLAFTILTKLTYFFLWMFTRIFQVLEFQTVYLYIQLYRVVYRATGNDQVFNVFGRLSEPQSSINSTQIFC